MLLLQRPSACNHEHYQHDDRAIRTAIHHERGTPDPASVLYGQDIIKRNAYEACGLVSQVQSDS